MSTTPIHPKDPISLSQAVELRKQEERAQAFLVRQDLTKKLHLRCVELALTAQTQNAGEVLSTEQLIERSEAIRKFVLTGVEDAKTP